MELSVLGGKNAAELESKSSEVRTVTSGVHCNDCDSGVYMTNNIL